MMSNKKRISKRIQKLEKRKFSKFIMDFENSAKAAEKAAASFMITINGVGKIMNALDKMSDSFIESIEAHYGHRKVVEWLPEERIMAQTLDIIFEETNIVTREKILNLPKSSWYPPDEISARSLAWIEAAKWLPQHMKAIKENESINPFKNYIDVKSKNPKKR